MYMTYIIRHVLEGPLQLALVHLTFPQLCPLQTHVFTHPLPQRRNVRPDRLSLLPRLPLSHLGLS